MQVVRVVLKEDSDRTTYGLFYSCIAQKIRVVERYSFYIDFNDNNALWGTQWVMATIEKEPILHSITVSFTTSEL